MGACLHGVERRTFSRSGKSGKIYYRCYTQERRAVDLGGLRIGKNGTSFQGIEFALNNGLRVCIATPRTDVVLELEPRFRHAFPGMEIAALYGGSPDVGTLSPLVISTTHQLLRYKEAFDVIIIDEVDAFPYSIDNTLQYAVKKSAKRQSAHIYLTATPSRDMKKRAESGKLHTVRIPARFHRSPLPEPTLIWCGNWERGLKRRKVPLRLKNGFLSTRNCSIRFSVCSLYPCS